MSDTKIPCTVEECEQTFTRKSDLTRHIGRKHSTPAAIDTVSGINLASGKTYTGRIIELTAQDFSDRGIRGDWDYYLIKTDDGDEIIVQVERSAA